MKLKLGAQWDNASWSVDAVCKKCGQLESECLCREPSRIEEKKDHKLIFKHEKRRGKSVTLVGPFYRDEEEKKSLVSAMKKFLGSGGTLDGEWIEAQGEHKEKLKPFFTQQGFHFKK